MTELTITLMRLGLLVALWAFVITKAMIAIGISAMALFIAGACAFAHRHALKPL